MLLRNRTALKSITFQIKLPTLLEYIAIIFAIIFDLHYLCSAQSLSGVSRTSILGLPIASTLRRSDPKEF
jgi:hypothetical protein